MTRGEALKSMIEIRLDNTSELLYEHKMSLTRMHTRIHGDGLAPFTGRDSGIVNKRTSKRANLQITL
jgi:hypothetical protein